MVNGDTTRYYLDGDRIVGEAVGSSYILYEYDESGITNVVPATGGQTNYSGYFHRKRFARKCDRAVSQRNSGRY